MCFQSSGMTVPVRRLFRFRLRRVAFCVWWCAWGCISCCMPKSIFWLKKLAKAATGEARIHRDDTYTEGTCKYCNAVLVHHRMAKKKIFCSQRCRLAWWAIEHKKPVKCKWCRKEISQVPGKKEKKFCSDRCRSKWWSRHVDKGNRKAYYEITCQYCQTVFASYGNKNRKYCCHECYVKDRYGK